MIARPPEKKFSSKSTPSSFFVKVANDNRPPKRIFLGWIFLVAGVLVVLGTTFWIYENAISYYRDATEWWTDEQSLKQQSEKPKDL